MRSLHFIEPHRLEWRDRPEPTLEHDTDILVRPTHVTLCDIDPLIIGGAVRLGAPFPIGHEAIGEVIAIGSAVTTLAIGQRVALTYYDSCGSCLRCGRGRPNRCDVYSPDLRRRRWHGIGYTETGYFDDLVRVRNADMACLALPPGLDVTHLAGLGDNLGFGYEFTIPHLQAAPGADVLIAGGGGAGSIGLYAAAFAVAAGAGRILYADTDDERLAIAERLGAQVHRGAPASGLGVFPITVDASGQTDGLLCAIRSTEPEGLLSSIGGHFQPVALPLFEMYAKGITYYTGPGRGIPNMAAALAMIAEGHVDPAPITSDILPLGDADRVLRHPPRKPVFIR